MLAYVLSLTDFCVDGMDYSLCSLAMRIGCDWECCICWDRPYTTWQRSERGGCGGPPGS